VGLATSKPGARDRAIEAAIRILGGGQAQVTPMQRRWRDKNYPELVLAVGRYRDDLPPFLSPPEGTREADDDREREQRMRANQQQRQGQTQQNPHQGNPNVNHSGPASSGKPVEGFVIMLKPNENPVCIMNTSSQVDLHSTCSCTTPTPHYTLHPRTCSSCSLHLTPFPPAPLRGEYSAFSAPKPPRIF